jgi:hypothetical protein
MPPNSIILAFRIILVETCISTTEFEELAEKCLINSRDSEEDHNSPYRPKEYPDYLEPQSL